MISETLAIDSLIRQSAPDENFEYPPKIIQLMQGQFLEYNPGKNMRARFPVLESYKNPMGNMQGGMIVTAIDNVMGPLCLLEAGATVTTHINTLFLRPVVAGSKHIDVNVEIVERSKRFIHLTAEAFNDKGKRVVSATSTFTII